MNLSKLIPPPPAPQTSGHGRKLADSVADHLMLLMEVARRRPDLRIALPEYGCESCGYTPSDDWTHVPGYPANAPIERICDIPCPECVNGHPEHNQVALRVSRQALMLQAYTLRSLDPEKSIKEMLEASGARTSIATDTYEWVFKRESMLVPIPSDARFFPEPANESTYAPLTPDGERARAKRASAASPASPATHESLEVHFWVWRREQVQAVDVLEQMRATAVDQMARNMADSIDAELVKAAHASIVRAHEKRSAALKKAVSKPDLERLRAMAPKGKRALAKDVAAERRKVIKASQRKKE